MRLTFNGKEINTDCKTAQELIEKLNLSGEVLIVNGFQTSEDHFLSEGDLISIIKKGVMPGKEELKSLMAARHTPLVYEKVCNASVAIAGLGGLGSNVAISLARTGVGKLLLVDYDIVEPSNLNRQSYYIRHLGMYKTEALYEQIKEINPFITVDIKTVKVTQKNVLSLFGSYDIVCEAFDNAQAKAMLVNEILLNTDNIKVVCASGMAGFDSSNLIKTQKCMKNLYVCGDFENEASKGNGLMAPRVQICAGHEANMILRLLLNIEEV